MSRLSIAQNFIVRKIAIAEGCTPSQLVRKSIHLLKLERRMQQYIAKKSLEAGKNYPTEAYSTLTGDKVG